MLGGPQSCLNGLGEENTYCPCWFCGPGLPSLYTIHSVPAAGGLMWVHKDLCDSGCKKLSFVLSWWWVLTLQSSGMWCSVVWLLGSSSAMLIPCYKTAWSDIPRDQLWLFHSGHRHSQNMCHLRSRNVSFVCCNVCWEQDNITRFAFILLLTLL